MRHFIIAAAIQAVWVTSGWAVLDYSSIGSVHTEDFDSLADSGFVIPWTNDSTLAGWSLFRATSATNLTPIAISFYEASDGSATAGRFYSFGDTAEDRALGSIGFQNFGDAGGESNIGFGNVLGWITFGIRNNTGQTIEQVNVGFDGEQWRDSGNGPGDVQTMAFDYRVGSTFDTTAVWTAPPGNFDFDSPFSGGGGALNGNTVKVAGLGGQLSGLNWTHGEILWLRWTELNDVASDHGLAIDNFSFSVVPEPRAWLFGAVLCGLIPLVCVTRWAAARVMRRPGVKL
jgi:hypothetical protein